MENFDYQGRRKDQYETNAKTMTMASIGMFVVIISMIVYGMFF